MRASVSVRGLLEWAFGAERASVEFGLDHAAPGRDTIALLMERGLLGCRVDGGGRSLPASDAEVVASVVASLPVARGGRSMAIRVAELARAGRAPDWMEGACTRLVPRGWRNTKHGMFAETQVLGHVMVPGRRGALVRQAVRCCPLVPVPTAAQIAAARRAYLDWWGALDHIRWHLATVTLDRWMLTDAMPPMEPWKKGG